MHEKLVSLIQVMFVETNPMPVKYAASLLKKSPSAMRLPLVQPTAGTQKAVQEAMAALGLI